MHCTANKVRAVSGSQTEDDCKAEAAVECAGSYQLKDVTVGNG